MDLVQQTMSRAEHKANAIETWDPVLEEFVPTVDASNPSRTVKLDPVGGSEAVRKKGALKGGRLTPDELANLNMATTA